jgi:hypothetical protein
MRAFEKAASPSGTAAPSAAAAAVDTDHYSQIFGHLTHRGAWDLQMLGRKLRRRYSEDMHFLPLPSSLSSPPPYPLPSLIFCRSTPFSRTVQSMQNLLIGLLTPDHRTNFFRTSDAPLLPNLWSSFGILPIHIRPPSNETLVGHSSVDRFFFSFLGFFSIPLSLSLSEIV